MAMDEKGLGQRLQRMRKAASMTQQELCHKAGLSYSTLAKIERGAIKSPSIFTIQNIAAALGVGLDGLLGTSPIITNPDVKTKLTAQSGVKFVFFDINGCLVRFFHSAFTRLASDTHTRPDEVESIFWHYNDAVCRGDMSSSDFNSALAKGLGVPSVEWKDYYLTSVEPIDAMRELVAWVSERYYIGLISNIMPGFIPAMQQRNLLPDIKFDVIIDSSVVGAIKPERAIFEEASRQASAQPQEILLIDDDRANLMAAEHLEWQVLWFDDYEPSASVERVRASLIPRD
jgi:FMN phosphatase YigB (HAD superfamily)/DNA-binding Xre family transcriptional regulator